MFIRSLQKPKKSFLLLGPRGTGKSTWLRTMSFAVKIDLLLSKERLPFLQNPSLLATRTAHLQPGDWVLIDEVQKVPELLDEVHSLYENKRLNFALSGSSARKLKRSGVNLLAGRAINCRMYPLIYSEYKSANFSINDLIDWGTLPLTLDNLDTKEDTLVSYLDNYLRQELAEEGLVRNIEPFARFLLVAGQMNGQTLNVENIARESKVKRSSVDNYFQILIDTLIGFKLTPYQPRLRINEGTHPKFYFFDSGVARAAGGYAFEPLDNTFRGFLFETFLLNEIRAYNDYTRKHRDLYFYEVRSVGDIDLIVQLQKKTKETGDRILALEFKLGNTWRSEWGKVLSSLLSQIGTASQTSTQVERAIVVYTGVHREQHGAIELWPALEFLDALHDGKIF